MPTVSVKKAQKHYDLRFRKATGSGSPQNPRSKKRRRKQKEAEEDIQTGENSESMMGLSARSDEEVDFTQIEQSASFPPTCMVLRLSPQIQPGAVTWLLQKLTGKKSDGGAELLVRCEPFNVNKRESLHLHITASKLKFLEVAEYMEFKKVDAHGVLRDFTVADLDNFLYEDVHLDSLLTAAEKQLIVLHELENIRALSGEDFVPGYPSLIVHSGRPIFQLYVTEGLISAYYPLHEQTELTNLGAKWYWAFFQTQPFEEIRKYFGEGISLYFSFLGFYTTSLIVPTIFGLLCIILPESALHHSLVFFCIFNFIWVTIFLELWKRKCSESAYAWGTLRMTKWEEPRPNYRGKMVIDPVTGRYGAKSAWWKTAVRVYGVSFPVVFICLLGAFWIMCYSFWAEEVLMETKHRDGSNIAGILVYLPSIVYTLLVYVMNLYYRKLAHFLTEWENHRTQSQFERHCVTKLVLFEFVNNFMSLFYIAFYIQDFEMLKYQVTVMLIVLQAVNHFQEALLPIVIKRAYVAFNNYILRLFLQPKSHHKAVREGPEKDNNANTGNAQENIWSPSGLGVQVLDSNDPRIEASQQESQLDCYEGTFDDYLELFIQFGYVFLFSAVYPLAAFWAILNNILEIRADAFKLCKVYQRPISSRVKDIGAWQLAFELMGAIAVMTNCALLCLSPDLRAFAPQMSSAEWLLLFVIIEHGLLALVLALRQLIPDVPQKIKIQLARLEFQSRQALKNEQAFKSRRQLTRRFKTIHGPRKKTSEISSSSNPVRHLFQRKSKPE